MSAWAFIMLVIAICGLVIDLFFDTGSINTSGSHWLVAWILDHRFIFQDMLLLLFALGVLIRIRVKTREGEKERLAAASRMKTRSDKRSTTEPWNKS